MENAGALNKPKKDENNRDKMNVERRLDRFSETEIELSLLIPLLFDIRKDPRCIIYLCQWVVMYNQASARLTQVFIVADNQICVSVATQAIITTLAYKTFSALLDG